MSDVVFEELSFKNFMSFGNLWTIVSFQKKGTVHIVGENLDEGGSSGAGKSTLIAALAYCLYDQIPSKVSKDKLLNRTNDKKNTSMEVKLKFRKGPDVYVVRRFRGEQNGMQLLLNDKDITPASVNRGDDSFNAKIEEIIGFSYSLFSQIILFNGNSKPFLDLGVGDQRNLIEELFKITTLTGKATSLKKRVTETDKEIDMQKLLNKQIESQNETHRRHVKEAHDRVVLWNEKSSIELKQLETQLEKLASISFDEEEECHVLIGEDEKKAQELKQQIQLLQSQIAGIERERFELSTDLANTNSSVKQNKSKNEKNIQELKHLKDAKCPYCLQEYQEAKLKIQGLESSIADLTKQIDVETELLTLLTKQESDFQSGKTDRINIAKNEVTKYQNEFNEISKRVSEMRGSLTHRSLVDMNNAKNSVLAIHEKIAKIGSDINPHIEAANKLVAEGETKVDYDAVDKLVKLQEQQQFLVKLLIDKNSFIRKNIISKTIPFLNKRIAFYTEKLNLPHIVLFQSDMTCQITQYGRELDHGNLSNGEKKKLNLSLCLAFRDVLTYLHAKVNLLLTDEVDGGSISGNDVDSLIGLLKRKAWEDEITILIISHRPEFEGRCDRNLVIRKEGGFSSLIIQPES